MKRVHLLLYLLPFLFLVLIFRHYFFSAEIISFGDFPYLYKSLMESWFKTIAFIWTSYHGSESFLNIINLFIPNFLNGLIAFLGFDFSISSRIIYLIPYIIFSYIFNILLLRKLLGNHYSLSIAPFIFIFNPFMILIAAWVNMAVAYAMLPFLFWSIIKFYETKSLLYSFLIGVSLFVTVVYEFRVGFIALLILVFYMLYHFLFNFSRKEFIKITSGMLTSGLTLLFLGAYIILPLYFSGDKGSVSEITAMSLFGTDFYNLQYALTLFHSYWTGEIFTIFSPHPIIFYFWVFPILAFSALIYVNKNKYIAFFSLLAIFGIFMTKGATPPLSGVYGWLFHFPFFNFFREPMQWAVMIGFSYTVLTACFVKYSFDHINEKFQISKKENKRRFYNYALKLIILFPIIVLLTSTIIPVFSGKMKLYSTTKKISNADLKVADFLSKDKFFYRTLNFPDISRFVYGDNTHPTIGFPYVVKNLDISLDPEILSYYNVKYIFLPWHDAEDNIYKHYAPKESLEYYLSSQKQLNFYKDFGDVKIWENPVSLPHIYAAEKLIYVNEQIPLAKISDLSQSFPKTHFYKTSSSEKASAKEQDNVTKTNDNALKLSSNIYSIANCIRCDISKKYYDYIKFPFARILPDSPLYSLIEYKEEKFIKSITSLEAIISTKAFFAEKRAVEIQEMLEKKINRDHSVKTITRYKELLIEIEKLSRNLEVNIENNNLLLNALDYILLSKRTLFDLANSKFAQSNDLKFLLKDASYKADFISKLLSERVWVTEGNKKRLALSVPSEGEYKILIKQDDDGGINDKVSLKLNGSNFLSYSQEGNWLNYKIHMFKKINYPIEIEIYPKNLLLTQSSGLILSSKTKINKYSIPIANLNDPTVKYRLSFDYRVVSGQGPRIFISTNADLKLDNNLINYPLETKIDDQDGKWHTSVNFFSPRYGYGISKSFLNFWLDTEGEESEIEIKNLRLIKVIDPVVILVKDIPKNITTPKIIYQQINPAFYIVSVDNAVGPYVLTLSETYSKDWRAYIVNNDKNLLSKDKIVAEYFDGLVKELKYLDKAKVPDIINTFFEKPIPDTSHISVNGFGNAWLIDKKGNYEIKLVFQPQRYFLIGFFVSIFSLIIIISSIIYLIRKEIIKSNKK